MLNWKCVHHCEQCSLNNTNTTLERHVSTTNLNAFGLVLLFQPQFFELHHIGHIIQHWWHCGAELQLPREAPLECVLGADVAVNIVQLSFNLNLAGEFALRCAQF